MTYSEWVEEHAKKHQNILEKLKNKSDDEVIEYFDYENMQKNEKDFCLLYAENKKCHDIEKLNCYLCACPHFRYKDEGGFEQKEGKTVFSYCSINAKKGQQFVSEDAIHHDCSNCFIPHKKEYIKKIFSRDWKFIIKESNA